MAKRSSSDATYGWLSAAAPPAFVFQVRKAAGARGLTVSAFMRAACALAMKAKPSALAPFLPPRRRLALEPAGRAAKVG